MVWRWIERRRKPALDDRKQAAGGTGSNRTGRAWAAARDDDGRRKPWGIVGGIAWSCGVAVGLPACGPLDGWRVLPPTGSSINRAGARRPGERAIPAGSATS